jgi:hypothetical protein
MWCAPRGQPGPGGKSTRGQEVSTGELGHESQGLTSQARATWAFAERRYPIVFSKWDGPHITVG